MVSKAAFFTVVTILNLINFILSTRFLIYGTLRCNNSLFQGANVSLCDGQTETNPTAIATSNNEGYFRLDANLTSSDSIYRVSIYHNCTSTTSEGVKEKIYTKQLTYRDSGMGERQQSLGVQTPLTISDLGKVRYDYNYKNCSATKN